MYALIHNLPAEPQSTFVALAGPCPPRPWGQELRSNLNTLAEPRVR